MVWKCDSVMEGCLETNRWVVWKRQVMGEYWKQIRMLFGLFGGLLHKRIGGRVVRKRDRVTRYLLETKRCNGTGRLIGIESE